MKKSTIKSLICQHCFTNIPNSFFVNSTISNAGYNWCLQTELVNGLCPICHEQTLFYVADTQLADIATIFYKLGFNIFQTREGESFFKSNNYDSIPFYIPYFGFEKNISNNILITEEFLSDLNDIISKYNWNMSGSIDIAYDNYTMHESFESIEDIKKYSEYNIYIWRVGIGLNCNYISSYINNLCYSTNNSNFKSIREKDKFINEEVIKFFEFKCNELYNALSTDFFDKWRSILCQELLMIIDQ